MAAGARFVSVAAIAGCLLSTSAHAEHWNGFYVGALAGGAWGNGRLATDVGTRGFPSYFSTDENIALVEGNSSGTARPQAFTGGAEIGFNRRSGQFVYGASLDYSLLDLTGTRGKSNASYDGFAPLSYDVTAQFSTNWLFTARARVGWLASPNLLLYATGGFAMSEVRASNGFRDKFVATGLVAARGWSDHTSMQAGFIVGGGLETQISDRWAIKAEYLYVDLGRTSTRGPIILPSAPVFNPLDTTMSVTASIARVGITYSLAD